MASIDASKTADPNANHNAEILSLTIAFVALSLLFLAARLASRRIKRAKLDIDDWFLIAAWIIALGEAVMIAVGTASNISGTGRHISTLTVEQIITFEKGFYVTSLLQVTILALAKISVLILLHRIFVTRSFRITIRVLGGIVMAWWAAIMLADAFICFPSKSTLDPRVAGHCGHQVLLNRISPIPWVLTDFAILVSPLPVIKQLQLRPGQKIGLCFLFLISGLTCVTSVIRYRATYYPLDDVTWDIVSLTNWTLIETHVTIACAASIASMPVVTLLIPHQLATSTRQLWSQFKSSRFSGNSFSQAASVQNQFGSSAQLSNNSPILPLHSFPGQGEKF